MCNINNCSQYSRTRSTCVLHHTNINIFANTYKHYSRTHLLRAEGLTHTSFVASYVYVCSVVFVCVCVQYMHMFIHIHTYIHTYTNTIPGHTHGLPRADRTTVSTTTMAIGPTSPFLPVQVSSISMPAPVFFLAISMSFPVCIPLYWLF